MKIRAANANGRFLTTYSCFHMAPHSRSVDVISVMTESSTGTTVSNCLRTHRREVKIATAAAATERRRAVTLCS